MVGVTDFKISWTGVLDAVGRGVAVVAGLGLVLVLGAQLFLQGFYADKVLPGVTVAGVDVGTLTLGQARTKIAGVTKAYRLDLRIDDKKFSATPADLGIAYSVEGTLQQAYAARRGHLLPTSAAVLPLTFAVDNVKLKAYVSGIAAIIGTEATDATLVVIGNDVVVVPDKNGWSVDPAQLTAIITADAGTPASGPVKLASTQQPARILAANVTPAIERANQLMAVPLKLTYLERSFVPTTAEIGSWLTFHKQTEGDAAKLETEVDTAKIRGYVQLVAGSINIAPVDKKITIENGVTKVDREGTDGLAIDQDAAATAIQAAVLARTPLVFPLTTHAVPFKTASTTLTSLDYGRYIEINLNKQHLWVWQDHAVIYDTPITSGATGAGFPTVTGLFSIYYKTTNTHLRGYAYGPRYNYDVQVDYWMPFYSGYGLHDASWRNGNFGGSDYYYGGSHGCVNLPHDAAAFIYNWADIGTPVWVHL